jgi:hypothetical protein
MRATYSNVVATLALFIALGGTSYAVTQLPRNSVGSDQIRKGAVASSEVRDRSLKAADFAHPDSLRGPPGEDGSAKAYLRVGEDGTVSQAFGFRTEARRLSPGRYCVDAPVLNDAPGNRARSSSPTVTTPSNAIVTPETTAARFATVEVSRSGGGAECQGAVLVSMFDAESHQLTDGAFYIALN